MIVKKASAHNEQRNEAAREGPGPNFPESGTYTMHDKHISCHPDDYLEILKSFNKPCL